MREPQQPDVVPVYTVRVRLTAGGLVHLDVPGLPFEQLDKLERALGGYYRNRAWPPDRYPTVGRICRRMEREARLWILRGEEPEKLPLGPVLAAAGLGKEAKLRIGRTGGF